jgi:transcriptional regulator with XRE-family HTH domain
MDRLTLREFKALLAKKIKKRRIELGLKQADLGVRLGSKDKQVISRYEVEGANPTIYNFIQLSKALELSVEELLNFSDLDDFSESN